MTRTIVLLVTLGALLTVNAALAVEKFVYPPDMKFQRCAVQGERCEFKGKKFIRYGAGAIWTRLRVYHDGVMCSSRYFGEPAPDITLYCEIQL